MNAVDYFGLLGAIYLSPRLSDPMGVGFGVICIFIQGLLVIAKVIGANA